MSVEDVLYLDRCTIWWLRYCDRSRIVIPLLSFPLGLVDETLDKIKLLQSAETKFSANNRCDQRSLGRTNVADACNSWRVSWMLTREMVKQQMVIVGTTIDCSQSSLQN